MENIAETVIEKEQIKLYIDESLKGSIYSSMSIVKNHLNIILSKVYEEINDTLQVRLFLEHIEDIEKFVLLKFKGNIEKMVAEYGMTEQMATRNFMTEKVINTIAELKLEKETLDSKMDNLKRLIPNIEYKDFITSSHRIGYSYFLKTKIEEHCTVYCENEKQERLLEFASNIEKEWGKLVKDEIVGKDMWDIGLHRFIDNRGKINIRGIQNHR